MPFFLGAHLIAPLLAYPADGYSLPYHKAIDLAAAFYGFVGLVFLYYFLRFHFHERIALLTVLLAFGGTGVFYYSMFDTGMSHVYSFALVSALLYVVNRLGNADISNSSMIALGALCGLVIAVRPVNALILLGLFIFFTREQLSAIGIRKIALALMAGSVILIPQVAYWIHLTGKPFMYSYGDESFSNLLTPKFINIWFAPNNGLFPYAPILVAALGGLIFLHKLGEKRKAVMLGLHFLAFSYVTSSWWMWSYGCSFGSRPFVDYVPLLTLPLGHTVQWGLSKSSKLLTASIVICLLLPILWTQKLTFSFGLCWYWHDWDWEAFFTLLTGPFK